MKTVLYLFSGMLVVLAASWTYKVNYQVQDAENRVAQLQRAIDRERSTIAVLDADWAYLNRPERLRALSVAYYAELRLMPVAAVHFADLQDVPLPAPASSAAVQQIVARLN
jgi:hypothetical protein